MKKKVILLSLLFIVIAACFIPVTQQKTISTNTPLLMVYRQLSDPQNWIKWRPDLRKISAADSNKISVQKDTVSFRIRYAGQELGVSLNENLFTVNDTPGNKATSYSYIILPDRLQTTVLDKHPKRTLITVVKKVSLFSYLVKPVSFSDTHIDDFKTYLENDSLFYGYKIFRINVPESNLIVVNRGVLSKDKFAEAGKMMEILQHYLKTHDVKQMRAPIAQFAPKGKDSIQLKVGFFINKEVKSEGAVTYMRMPKNGVFYFAEFEGKFNERKKVYTGLQQYLTNHLYQLALLPFETYVDGKLPVSDTSRVNIQVNFPSYF